MKRQWAALWAGGQDRHRKKIAEQSVLWCTVSLGGLRVCVYVLCTAAAKTRCMSSLIVLSCTSAPEGNLKKGTFFTSVDGPHGDHRHPLILTSMPVKFMKLRAHLDRFGASGTLQA